MKCTRCGKEMKVKPVVVGNDEQGNPIYNNYAFCYECKIKINLDKKKEKKEPDDLGLTRKYEAQLGIPEKKEPEKRVSEESTAPSSNRIKERAAMHAEKKSSKPEKPVKKEKPVKPEKPEKAEKPEKPMKAEKPEQPKKPMKEDKPVREEKKKTAAPQKKRQPKMDDMLPEKRVKEVIKHEKPRRRGLPGFVKFIIFLLVVAAIGTAAYVKRDTVKRWIGIGLEKFDSMSDNTDDKNEDDADGNKDILDDGTGDILDDGTEDVQEDGTTGENGTVESVDTQQ